MKKAASHDAKKFVQPLKFELSWYSLGEDGGIEKTLEEKTEHMIHVECKNVIYKKISYYSLFLLAEISEQVLHMENNILWKRTGI